MSVVIPRGNLVLVLKRVILGLKKRHVTWIKVEVHDVSHSMFCFISLFLLSLVVIEVRSMLRDYKSLYLDFRIHLLPSWRLIIFPSSYIVSNVSNTKSGARRTTYPRSYSSPSISHQRSHSSP
jgi:hypothetical protein